jgi:crossover junction endodeoxyribonuclease RusA
MLNTDTEALVWLGNSGNVTSGIEKSFFVKGKPVSQGSLKFIKGRAIHVKGRELALWRGTIAAIARGTNITKIQVGVDMDLVFIFNKPKTVKRDEPFVRPDLDKLIRAVLDGLTGVAYEDDQQVVRLTAQKAYGETEGVHIRISERLSGGIRPSKDFVANAVQRIDVTLNGNAD